MFAAADAGMTSVFIELGAAVIGLALLAPEQACPPARPGC